MIPGSANSLLLASQGGYSISRSLRFNSADSAYLSRTFGSPTDQDVFTLSMWVKRSALGSTQQLFGVSTNHGFGFTSGDALNLTFGGSSALTTTALFRDPSAWYHIVWKQNANAHELYVNGVSVGTATATSNTFNTAAAHQLGAANTTNYFPGYLADIHFIDGQALTPTSFGEFDDNGIWQPKAYTGSYGTNGFRLDFSDNSAATATTLGKDAAGSNNWTPNNLSVTAGAGNDSLVDVPTNGAQTDTGAGGEVGGNYCTLNPLNNSTTLSDGNLKTDAPTNTWYRVSSTFHVSSGKWYWEVTPTALGLVVIGVANKNVSTASGGSIDTANSYTYYSFDGNKFGPTSNNTSYGAAYAANDIIGVALDLDAGTLVFYKNNTSQGTAYSGLAGIELAPFIFINDYSSSATAVFNFGQRPFAYTAPSGFKALNTANLPAPVVTKPSDVMDVKLYTGNGSTQTISGLGFSPDLVWLKSRSNALNHRLIDQVQGNTSTLASNLTTAAVDCSADFTAFTSTGFSVNETASFSLNASSYTYAAWCWDAGTTTTTNTVGSISSQVRANASAGFSAVTYTGTGANATVGHALGVAPGMVIVKRRDTTANWQVRHTSIAVANSIQLNLTNAAASATTAWNSTAPSSTVFSVGTDATVNASGGTYVAYCFAPVAGYSSFGSYTGNGSADGPMVWTGFRPRWILFKESSASGNSWYIYDSVRGAYNVVTQRLVPDASLAELTNFNTLDMLSNGWKVRDSNSAWNASGATYIYAAFAEHPFQYARAR